MGAASRVRKLLALLLACGPLCAGCGADSEETAPAEQPSVGPGVAPGGGTSERKGSPFTQGGKSEKGAPEKSAEKK